MLRLAASSRRGFAQLCAAAAPAATSRLAMASMAERTQIQASILSWGAADAGALGLGTLLPPALQPQSQSSQSSQSQSPRGLDSGSGLPRSLGAEQPAPLFVSTPTRVPGLERYVPYAIAAGWAHSLVAVQNPGLGTFALLGAGLNTSNQIGLIDPETRQRRRQHEAADFISSQDGDQAVPAKAVSDFTFIHRFDDQPVVSMACGRQHSIVATATQVVGFGNNHYGQCGILPFRARQSPDFVHLNLLLTGASRELANTPEMPLRVACGLDLTLILHADVLYASGWGADGQTGLGVDTDVRLLSPIVFEAEDFVGEKVHHFATRADCSYALVSNSNGVHRLFTWGNSEYGQTSLGKKPDKYLKPHVVPGLGAASVKQIAAGGSFAAFLTADGCVHTCGYGPALGRGNHTLESLEIAQLDRALFNFEPVVQLVSGNDYVMALTVTGKLFAWGRGQWGRLGLGHTADAWVPTRVPIEGKVTSVACGVDHTLAIVVDNE
ncbi:hypothetical protein CAOG_03928 [Capsaspora owczarzaki ATCC 30864]|uniref:Uncharacterized protein n=1 Tax=Capsaspora owczarzaki (strain ATCC 30864) TaxID=595528 RepID=A0A0D2WP69_CAPO3|nr:hypothetical protein CAOG_03928 [Capsaspora owczarzaki ATCC 30864]KJE93085.1 hypothetical protein CAOG_003928 [Capsaspora owczarzaki ATCC 30864]|eukprot:XP_004363656.2 hypothetical protein CAOG_03928 [Capsaspora owczarzaki ATCC 30864]